MRFEVYVNVRQCLFGVLYEPEENGWGFGILFLCFTFRWAVP